MTAPSNWGVFGPDDEIGTLNHLTPEVVLWATGAVRSGDRFPLNLPLDLPDHKTGGGLRYQKVPFRRNARVGPVVVNEDSVLFTTQGSSQWDGLAHFGLEEGGVAGVFYNGVGMDAVDEAGFAHRLGIDRMAEVGIVGRGVLVDIARWRAGGSADPLPPEHVITPEETAACLAEQGVDVEPGDIVCFRTGWVETYLSTLSTPADERGPLFGTQPGVSPDHAPMAHEQRWAAVAADNLTVEAYPPSDPAGCAHAVMLRNLGMPFGELLVLGDLAASCAADRRWTFLFVAVPLHIRGGTGSPANAIAIR